MRNMTLALLFASILVASGSAFGADAVQDAYTKFEATASSVQQQIYAKQTELNSLMVNNQAQSPRVQELFREIGELEGQLYVARSELNTSLNAAGGGAYPRRGMPFRGGPGYGYCHGGYNYNSGGYGHPGYNGGGWRCW